MKILITSVLLFQVILLFAQTEISGKITDENGKPVMFANVYIKDSYDGTTTNEEGIFKFNTALKDSQQIVISCIGYETFNKTIFIENKKNIPLNTSLNTIAEEIEKVIITAGAFEASDEKKGVILRPLDIVTTAGALADVSGAMRMLPGAQQIGEEGGLFVRGGSASETKTIIDGMEVKNPYYSPVPDVPERGRFNPFMFKGTYFSTGGYSAIYGQALSSVLVLNTTDFPDTTLTSIGLMVVGASAAHTQSWDKFAFNLGLNYTNVKPYFSMNKQLVNWDKEPYDNSGEMILRYKPTKNGLIKFYSYYSNSGSALNYNINDTAGIFSIKNDNLFINSSYKEILSDKMSAFVGLSYSRDIDNINDFENNIGLTEGLLQGKVVFTNYYNNNSNLKYGAELQKLDVDAKYNQYKSNVNELFTAVFAETEIAFTKRIATRIGGRYEYSKVLDKYNVAPRISCAYKTGANSQISLAYGKFYQRVEDTLLLRYNNINYENAQHFIANYQWMNNDRTFRIETYYKLYDNLALFDTSSFEYSNRGDGYAKGIDIFWRDQKTIPNFDYWISYSYIDSKRKFRNQLISVRPDFISDHTICFIGKYWINPITTSVSLSYVYATERYFYRMNADGEYLPPDKTKYYSNLSLSVSKIMNIFDQFVIIFASFDNMLNRKNVFAYRYSTNGEPQPIGPSSLRTFFVGCFISIQ